VTVHSLVNENLSLIKTGSARPSIGIIGTLLVEPVRGIEVLSTFVEARSSRSTVSVLRTLLNYTAVSGFRPIGD
jgi:hypothetical protein